MLIQRKLNAIEKVIGGKIINQLSLLSNLENSKMSSSPEEVKLTNFHLLETFFSSIKVDYRHRILLFQVILIALLFILIIIVWKRFRKIIYEVSKKRQKKK
jgi:hypothetical protein